MTTPVALTAVVCLGLGGLVGWLIARARATEAAAALRADHARMAAELAGRDRVIPDKLALLDAMQRQLRDSFDALAAAALHASSQQFLTLADQKIGNLHRAATADIGSICRHKALTHGPQARRRSATDWSVIDS